MDYLEKLKDPRWQKKRLKIFERDGWQCKFCGLSDLPLHVHHLFYFKNREPWEINDGFLLTLCEDCHDSEGKEEIIEDIGTLLDAIWGCGFDNLDFTSISSALLKAGKVPHGTPDTWDIGIRYKKLKRK